MQEFVGKVAVVTGAASGIGRAVAKRLAVEGMAVVMADIEAAALTDAATELADAGHRVLAVPTDVRSREAIDRSSVADMVVDGIRTDRFWIPTHPAWFDVMSDRASAMREGRLHHGFGG